MPEPDTPEAKAVRDELDLRLKEMLCDIAVANRSGLIARLREWPRCPSCGKAKTPDKVFWKDNGTLHSVTWKECCRG